LGVALQRLTWEHIPPQMLHHLSGIDNPAEFLAGDRCLFHYYRAYRDVLASDAMHYLRVTIDQL
jgi:hypothetical protein